MNRFLLLTISTLLVSVEVPGLRAMDRTDEDNQEQSVASPLSLEILLECMVCSHTHWIPADIDPLIIKQMILLDANQYFENCLNTQTCTAKTLADNLTQFSKKFSALDDKYFPEIKDLGTLLASHLEKHKISVSTLIDDEQQTVLHWLLKEEKCDTTLISIILYAAGAELHKLAQVQNKNGETIIHVAAALKSSIILKMLLDAPEIDVSSIAKIQTTNGQTVLTQAVCWNNAENVRLLLSSPRINAKERAAICGSHNKTILHMVAYFNSIQAMQALQSSSDINMQQLAVTQCSDGNTPLHDAAFRGNLEAVTALCNIPELNLQDLIMIRNNEGKTALDYAIEFSFDEIIEFLLEKLALTLDEFLSSK